MRLIEKSLTENIYNALNESSDQNKAAKRAARYKKSNRVRMNESDKYYVSFSSGELNMDVPFNNDKIKREVIKGKGGKGPDGVETDLIKYIGTKEDLEKLMDKDFDGEYKNSIKKLEESEEEQLNDLYNADKVEWDDLSGSDQTAVEYFSSNFGDNIAGKSWDEVESDIIEACYDIGYANEELINSGYWMDGDMDPEPDEKKVTDYIFQNYFLPKKNSKNMNESAETGNGMPIKEYAMRFCDGYIDTDVTDTEVGMLVAFVYDFNEEPKDNYDRFLNLLGERTKVVKVGNNVLTCDFSSVFKPYEDKLQDFFNMDYSEFNEAYYEAVVNLEPLISGNAGEKTYKELIDILTSKQVTNEADNLESLIDEAARYLFNEGDEDYLPDYEEFNDSIMEISKDLFDKAKERALEALTNLAEHQYYDDDSGYGTVLELNDNHTMWELTNENKSDEEWASIVNSKQAQFKADTGVDLLLLGRMGRHACVEPTYDNCLNFTYLQETQERLEREAIDEFNGKQINESANIDNDPDLDADQVQADNDYWTDVDEDDTEDVSDMRPIGVYTISNNSAIYVYQIEYDIVDRVLAGDSSDETKAKWRDIIYDDEDAYFWYGDIKVPFNDVVRTDI